ncbi:M48 family metalloprotease [Streptomyces sp. NPDC001939]
MSAPVVGSGVSDLDRRVLGSGTTLRFALLAVLVTVSCAQLVWLAAPRPVSGLRNPEAICALAAGEQPQGFSLVTVLRLAALGTSSGYEDCVWRYSYRPWVWVAGGTVLVFVLALVLYWWLPLWKSRGSRLVPVRDPELLQLLAELSRTAGLGPVQAPKFVMDPVAATPSAVVFGRWRSYTVSLHGGLIARRVTDPEGFRTVVLHELAHIRNGDVTIAYATDALWRAFALVILLPYTVQCIYPWPGQTAPGAVVELWRTRWESGLQGVVHPMVLAAVVLLARADVLRTRELYADLDAARWAGARKLPGSSVEPRRGALARFAALWRTHPAWSERAESLLDPAALFGIRAITMFLTAFAAAEAVAGILLMSSGAQISPTTVAQLTAWPAAMLITGIAGVALWRAVTHAVLTGRPVPSGLRAGAWLGLGLAAGELLTFRYTNPGGWLPPAPQALLVLVAAPAVLTWWTAQCAVVWIRTSRGRSLNAVHLLGLAAMLVVFGAWFAWWYSRGNLYLAGDSYTSALARSAAEPLAGTAGQREMMRQFGPTMLIVWDLMKAPLLPVGGALLWLFPLAAWTRRPVNGVPPWVRRALPFTEVPSNSWSGLPPLRRVLGYGTGGGALAVCAVVITRAWLHTGPVMTGGNTALSEALDSLWTAFALCTAITVTAVITYARAPGHPLPVALVAAGSAALVGVCGVYALSATEGCVPVLAVHSRICGWKTEWAWFQLRHFAGLFTLGMGFYMVTITMLAGPAARRLAARRWGAPTGPDPRVPPMFPNASESPGPWPVGVSRAWALAGLGAGLGVLGVVAVRAWLRGRRPDGWSMEWFQYSHEWIAASLVTAVVVAVLMATAASGRRRFLHRALLMSAAGGAALLAGSATVFVLGAAEGCVRSLNAIAATCGWRPDLGWTLIRIAVLPAALGQAICVAAVLTVLAVAWQRIRGRRAADPWPARHGGTSSVRRLRERRAYTVAACLIALVIASGWWQPRSGGTGITASDVSTPTATASEPSADQRRARIAAWLATGGLTRVQNFTKQTAAFGTAAGESAKKDGIVDPEVFGPLCRNWITQGRRAQAGMPVPDTPLQTLWQNAAEEAVQGGTDCVRGLRDGDSTKLTDGLQKISRFAATFGRFTTLLGQAQDGGTSQGAKG